MQYFFKATHERGDSCQGLYPLIILLYSMRQSCFFFFFLFPGKMEENELLFKSAAAAAKSLQSCPSLCDPRDGSPPGSPVPGILQARTLEWVAISFSNAGK